MPFLPLIISLAVGSGRPVRSANSFWLMPRTSSSSARSSPGGIGRSEYILSLRSVAIVLAHLLDDHRPLVFTGNYDQAGPASQCNGPLSFPVSLELVYLEGMDRLHVTERLRDLQRLDPLNVL